jgi:DNA-binding NarL/FixJ family response regulator
MASILEHRTASVLLIDANKADRTFYAVGLKRCSPDYLILEAGDGQTGRQIYGCVRVDCVVLELVFPDQSGFGLLQHIDLVASRPNVAVLVLTLVEHPRVHALAKQFGALAFLEKAHTSPEDLDRAIQLAMAIAGDAQRDYRLPGPVEGEIGPRHKALSGATGLSLSGHQTVSSPLVSRTCTMMSRDGGARRIQ